jgi:hypothetical protein
MNVSVCDTPLISRELFLESHHAASTSNGGSRCVWHLPHHDLSVTPNFLQMGCVVQASVPVSWYNIPNGSVIEFSIDDGEYTKTLNIPGGNYSLTQFLTVVDEALRDCGWSYTKDGVTHLRPTIAWDARSNKVSFTSTLPLTLTSNTTLYKPLGFTAGSHTSDTLTLRSDSCCDIRGHHMLYLQMRSVSGNMVSTLGSSNTICHIPVSVGVYATQVYSNNSATPFILASDTSSIELTISDSHANPIDLNNMEWSVTIRVDYRYIREVELPPRLQMSHNAWSHSYKKYIQDQQEAQQKAREIAHDSQMARLQKISVLQNFLNRA